MKHKKSLGKLSRLFFITFYQTYLLTCLQNDTPQKTPKQDHLNHLLNGTIVAFNQKSPDQNHHQKHLPINTSTKHPPVYKLCKKLYDYYR
jgi:hypothetical protein